MPSSHFLIAGLQIVLIDLLLAGDNALVIAMAVRNLPTRERRLASAWGAGLAVLMRVALTFVAAEMLQVRFLKLAGGLLILWIAVKVLWESEESEQVEAAPPSLKRAIWYVLIADLTMSIDNILAIAGASGPHIELIIFGLALSIPFIVVSSNLLVNLMNRYPIVVYLGAGILGKVGGEMAMSDPWVESLVKISTPVRYGVDAALIAAIWILGWWGAKRKRLRMAPVSR
jgi:YjbE family integral membrane protein